MDSGAKGLVIGAITSDNLVDEQFLQLFREKVSNKVEVTFHKASDQVTSLSETYDVIKKYEIERVLTQGGKGPVLDNQEVLRGVIGSSGVKTLVGGGINIDNVGQVIK